MTPGNRDPVIGHRWFVDGVERAVYQDAQGQQYVLDNDGSRVDGVWVVPDEEPDAPFIVAASEK